MGRVSPPKVFSGQTVNDGNLNSGIADFDVQSKNIDGLNVCDEALGFEELQGNSFVRNFSLWGGKGPSRLIGDYHDGSDTYANSRVLPRWSPDNSYSLNGSAALPNRPHVKITNNPDNGDVTIIRVSCGIYMDDYGFQTLRRNFGERFKGPIIGCSVGFADSASTAGNHYTRLNQTRQWFQLPWSGAKWNDPPRPYLDLASRYHSGGTGSATILSPEYFGDDDPSSPNYWYDTPDGLGKQWVTSKEWDSDDPVTSAMAFCYNFNYQSTYVWKPSGSGNQTGVFALMALSTFDPLGTLPFWEPVSEDPTGDTDIEWEEEDEDGTSETKTEEGTQDARFIRQGVEYPGFYIRNCSMNAITYTMGR